MHNKILQGMHNNILRGMHNKISRRMHNKTFRGMHNKLSIRMRNECRGMHNKKARLKNTVVQIYLPRYNTFIIQLTLWCQICEIIVFSYFQHGRIV